MKIQNEAYDEITPEPLSVLQGKWRRSPELCFVYENDFMVLSFYLVMKV